MSDENLTNNTENLTQDEFHFVQELQSKIQSSGNLQNLQLTSKTAGVYLDKIIKMGKMNAWKESKDYAREVFFTRYDLPSSRILIL